MRRHDARLRKGDFCEPLNWRRNGSIEDRYYVPFAFLSNSYLYDKPSDGMIAWPFVLPKTHTFTRLAWRVSGIGTQTYIRFAFYATDPSNVSMYPFPGRLIWGMPTWRLVGSSGHITDGDYSPPVILPGNQLLWAVQAGYTLYELGMEGSLTSMDDYDINQGNGKCGIPNILGYQNLGDNYFANCYWWITSPAQDNFSWPDTFPTTNIYVTNRSLPLFGWIHV